MILLIFLYAQVTWQAVNRPYSELEQELVIYFSISENRLKPVAEDSLFYVEYETQLKVFDKKHNQLTGDYWETKHIRDTATINDSVKLKMPKESDYFEMKIIDLNGGEVFRTTDKILKIKYIGDIQWSITKDTLTVVYTIINPNAEVDWMLIKIEELEQTFTVEKGRFHDTIKVDVSTLPNGNYKLRIEMYADSRKLDLVQVPITVSRIFFLDDASWNLKVEQLMYIATPNEIKKLKDAKKSERDSLWRSFWEQHDPTPNTPYNEKEIEYFERIEYCEAHFSHGDTGWRSDRAKIYVKYGPPDEIQSYPYYSPPKNPYNPIPTLYDAYLVWNYYRINRQFIFGDKHGLGQYILLNPGGSNL
ncbi:MAG TPA: GWxTD domain-containing protein [candidate division WOR-3 bacterium]|uniref:GWxTD domain-containing protein n=1 Tax=candidate division WOR-3 bacterium TaxID=2052148 RepID=A0A9C9K0R2_UNCW3|nr:GWxTD domain-containing protein [candidate division WOR-3 bacterium]